MPQNKFEHAIIVGGSLGGLMMGLALSRSGYTVTILERADSSLRNGAFIRLHTKPSRNSEIERELRHLASSGDNNVEAWSAIQERLRNAVANEPGITLQHHTRIVSVGQNESSAWATSEEEQTFKGDFLIGADGYRSIVRRYLSPDKPFADYAGYLVWVGKVDEKLLPKNDWKKRQLSSAYFNDSAAGTLTTAVMPGIEGGTNPGQRWIGFCWFDHSHNHLLSELGVLKGGIAQHKRGILPFEKTVKQKIRSIYKLGGISMNDTKNRYVTVLWEARAKAGREAEMKAFMTAAVTPSRNDLGNIDYEAHEVEGQPGTFIIYERWENRDALDRHLSAPRMQELVPQLLELMEGSIEEGIRLLQPFRPAQ
ncbi:antibiotic biosynthesis monooxygenase [Paenibacillus riograndensis]|nr:antibiotic biosynthesis monooxygenase [Paenibacillus riograndensis]